MPSTNLGRRRPGQRTQAERSEATKRKILRSALRLLQRDGFQGTTLQDIARGARVTLGAVQHQFKTRDNLMERIADEVMEPLANHGAVWPPAAASLPFTERAKEFVTRAWEHLYGTPHYVAAWSLFFGAKSTAPAIFRRIDRRRKELDPIFFKHFVDLFPEIAERRTDATTFASFVLSSLRGIALIQLFETNDKVVQAELKELTRVILFAGGIADSLIIERVERRPSKRVAVGT